MWLRMVSALELPRAAHEAVSLLDDVAALNERPENEVGVTGDRGPAIDALREGGDATGEMIREFAALEPPSPR